MTSVNRMSSHDTFEIPRSKLVLGGFAFRSPAMPPKRVFFPTATAIPVPLPLMTLLPVKARFSHSVAAFFSPTAAEFFSAGSLSPVRADWPMKRSLLSTSRMSAGTRSPADSLIRSPTTISSGGISRNCPSLLTVAVAVTMSASFFAAFPERVSCMNRSMPEKSSIAEMTMTVTGFLSPGAAKMRSVHAETTARKNSMALKGLIKASASLRGRDFSFFPPMALAPKSSRCFSA